MDKLTELSLFLIDLQTLETFEVSKSNIISSITVRNIILNIIKNAESKLLLNIQILIQVKSYKNDPLNR